MKFDIFSGKKFKCIVCIVCEDKFKTDAEAEQYRKVAHPRQCSWFVCFIKKDNKAIVLLVNE